MFSGRAKDKSKSATAAADAKQSSADSNKLLIAPIVSTAATSSTKSVKDTSTLPPVRGSFQSFDYDKSKKPKVAPQKVETPAGSSDKPTTDIPSSSWLNKAKDGTKALASMFTKPKGS